MIALGILILVICGLSAVLILWNLKRGRESPYSRKNLALRSRHRRQQAGGGRDHSTERALRAFAPPSGLKGRLFCPDCEAPARIAAEVCEACGLLFSNDTEVGAEIWPAKALDDEPLLGPLVLTPRGLYFLPFAVEESDDGSDVAEKIMGGGLLGGGVLAAAVGMHVALSQDDVRTRLRVTEAKLERLSSRCLDERALSLSNALFLPASQLLRLKKESRRRLHICTEDAEFAFEIPAVPAEKLDAVTRRLWGVVTS